MPATQPDQEDDDKFSGIETPNRLAFALGWIVANQIIQKRYRRNAIDALPIYHPENGWDRFLLSRRVTAKQFAKEDANAFGMIMLDGEDAPRLTTPGGKTILSLGQALRDDPDAAIKNVLKNVRRPKLPEEGLGPRWKDRRKQYPRLYNAATEIIVENPGTIVAREIFVDNREIDGAYHPLYLHGVSLEPKLIYDWLMIQRGRWAVFVRNHAGQTIYETDRRTWSTIKKQLAQEEDDADVKRRLAGWLRLTGESLVSLDPKPERPARKGPRKPIPGVEKNATSSIASGNAATATLDEDTAVNEQPAMPDSTEADMQQSTDESQETSRKTTEEN